jgi:hypothetical protein
VGDELFLGKPFEIETTVIKPDARRIEFFAYEYMGMELLRWDEEKAKRGWQELEPIKDKDALKVGDPVAVPHPIVDGFWIGEVKAYQDGTLYASFSNGAVIASLAFGIDDRNSWVCCSFGNTKGLVRIDFD